MRFIEKIEAFFDRNSIASATFLIFISYLISSVLGLFRNRLLAQFFGDSSELGVFYLADRLPNFIFSTLVLTVLTTSFIPICVSTIKKGKSELNDFVSNSINIFLFFYLLIIIPIFIFPSFFARLVSWNSFDASYTNLLSSILIWDLLSQFLFILSSFLSSYLQSIKKFFIPAINPIIFNLGVVIGIFFFHSSFGIYSTIIGMFIGNILSLIFIYYFVVKTGFKYILELKIINEHTKKLISLASPRFIGILIQRLYILLIGGLISFIYKNPAYLVIYEFANQLQTMPVQAFGNSLSQVLLPTFSDLADREKRKKIAKTLNRYVLQLTYFLMPVVAMFFILKIPIIRILYGGDKFSWLGTNLTSYTLAFFSLSIWSQAVNAVFFRVFYSFKNSIIPTYSSVIALLSSFILALYFGMILHLGLWSLALAFSIGSILQTIYLYIFLRKRLGNFIKNSMQSYLKIIYSTLIMGFILYLTMQFFDTYVFDTTRTLPLVLFTSFIMSIGFVVYFLFLDIVGVKIARSLALRVRNLIKGI